MKKIRSSNTNRSKIVLGASVAMLSLLVGTASLASATPNHGNGNGNAYGHQDHGNGNGNAFGHNNGNGYGGGINVDIGDIVGDNNVIVIIINYIMGR